MDRGGTIIIKAVQPGGKGMGCRVRQILSLLVNCGILSRLRNLSEP